MINEVLLFDLASMRWLTYGRTDMVSPPCGGFSLPRGY